MTESRPRPQYGEYASPEEQAKAMGISLEHTAQAASSAAPPAVPSAASVAVPGAEPSAEPGAEPSAEPVRTSKEDADAVGHDPAVRVKRSRDTVVTVLLLLIGLAWILLSIPGTSDLAGTLDRTYALQGYTGHYGPVALASALGLAINIISLVLWGIACAVSIAVLRSRRRAFYIPLIGAVLTGLVVVALTIVAMFNDPGLVAYLGTLQK